MTLHRYLAVIFSLFLGTVETVVAQENTERFEKVTQRLVQAINAQDYPATRQDFSQAMLDALPSDKSKQFFTKVLNQFGKIEEVGSPRLTAPNRAVFTAHCALRDLDITVVLDEHNKIAGLTLTQAIPVPDRLLTSFHLPFGGQWLVFWGGDSREHEVSVLCHFQQGSIRVRRGERVKQGQVVGLCGNSGKSSEPHIHFHVQNTPITQNATGLRCVFEKITVTRKGTSEMRTNHAPVKGDIVREE